MNNQELKQKIINAFSDCMMDLFYYDRKEDDDLPVGEIENAIKNGIITVDEILAIVKQSLGS